MTAHPLRIESTSAVVRQLDEQVLSCVEDEPLTAAQQGDLLAWVHDHLVSAYAADLLDRYPGPTPRFAARELICPCRSSIEMIGNMLQGGVPLGPDLTFQCPPSGCPSAFALSRKLPAWLRRRVTLAAQRTRLHTDAELAALWGAIEEHLITGAIAWFDLDEYLEVDVPTLDALDATTRGCLEAVRGRRGLTWTSGGGCLPSLVVV